MNMVQPNYSNIKAYAWPALSYSDTHSLDFTSLLRSIILGLSISRLYAVHITTTLLALCAKFNISTAFKIRST